jgi:hypothetical protein
VDEPFDGLDLHLGPARLRPGGSGLFRALFITITIPHIVHPYYFLPGYLYGFVHMYVCMYGCIYA